jgi:hypothetical protein
VRISRPRFTARRLMIAVAIAGLAMAFLINPLYDRERWGRIAEYHQKQSELYQARWEAARGGDPAIAEKLWERFRWHRNMAWKYGMAHTYPSMPPRDPPPRY